MCQNGKKKLYGIYRPNTGLQTKQETIQDIKKKYKKVKKDTLCNLFQQRWKRLQSVKLAG